MKYELEALDVQNILAIIDQVQITGKMAETIVMIKNKLRSPIKEEIPCPAA